MNRTLSLLLVLILALSVFGTAAAETQESSYFFGENIYGILNTGEEALADGMDPKWVLTQMKDAADIFDCADVFNSLCENIAAYENKNYNKMGVGIYYGGSYGVYWTQNFTD